MIMSIQPFLQNIEIQFWKFIIPLMQNSPSVRKGMLWAYRAVITFLDKKTILMVVACILAGGAFGLLLGVLSQFR